MRKAIAAAAVTLAIVLAGAVSYRLLFREERTQPTWTVATWTGGVEVRVGGSPFAPATMKQGLSDGDAIRTGPDGEATLVHGESHVTVRSGTTLEVAQLNADASRFSLGEGQVFVEARGDRVSMRSTAGAQLDAEDAGVGMTVRRDGWTQVQVKRGAADFTAMDRTERVLEGQESHAAVGAPPSAPAAIPDDLLLSVRFPDAETFNARLAHVEGKADPGSRVRVAGRAVDVGLDGAWRAEVELAEGVQQIEVVAQDSIGNARTARSHPIRVDVTAPSLEGASIGSRSVSQPGAGGLRLR